jgi:hypothetical protein
VQQQAGGQYGWELATITSRSIPSGQRLACWNCLKYSYNQTSSQMGVLPRQSSGRERLLWPFTGAFKMLEMLQTFARSGSQDCIAVWRCDSWVGLHEPGGPLEPDRALDCAPS